MYEAASAIVNLPGCSAKELAPAVSGDQALPTQAPRGSACQELGPGPGGAGKKGNALRRAAGYGWERASVPRQHLLPAGPGPLTWALARGGGEVQRGSAACGWLPWQEGPAEEARIYAAGAWAVSGRRKRAWSESGQEPGFAVLALWRDSWASLGEPAVLSAGRIAIVPLHWQRGARGTCSLGGRAAESAGLPLLSGQLPSDQCLGCAGPCAER